MVRCWLALLFVVVLGSGVAPMAAAQSEPRAQPMGMMQALPIMNRIKPLQNPKYTKASGLIGRSVIDRANAQVGRVEDVQFTSEGAAAALRVTFDALRLGQPVYLRYDTTRITPASNGYKIGLQGAEVAGMYPELLAGIETAAGDGADIFSVRGMMGAKIYTPDGVAVGEIAEVLLNEPRTRAEGFYMQITQGAAKGKAAAVPFGALIFEEKNGAVRARMAAEDYKTLLRFMQG